MTARIGLSLLGAAGMILGGFLEWIANTPSGFSTAGTKVPFEVLWSTTTAREPAFFTSIGAWVILLGILAIIGLAFDTGWLTRLAGALGIVTFVLFLITLFRVDVASLGLGDVGLGVWSVLIGGVLAVIAGFMGSRRVIAVAPPPAV